jgi:hypothetical protein
MADRKGRGGAAKTVNLPITISRACLIRLGAAHSTVVQQVADSNPAGVAKK